MAAPPRSTARRRWLGVVALVVLAVVLGVATSVLTGVGGGERVSRLWVAATLSGDGSAAVVEVVDYDFGAKQRHGIFRDVPGLRRSAPVQVSSPDAPDGVTVENDGSATRLRIGDPARTVSGEHRYVLRYTLDGVVRNGQVAWDAVGTGWDVPIDEADVHVVAPTALAGARCAAGSTGSTDACAVRETRPGALTARATDLGSGQGLTLYAATGAALAGTPALPTPPGTAPAQERVNPGYPGLLAGGLAALAGLLCSWLLRRAGREHAPDVGLPVAAAPGEAARIDLAELGRSAVPSPSLPAGLSPAQGGVLLAEGVGNQHKAAWLIEQAVAGAIDLEGGETVAREGHRARAPRSRRHRARSRCSTSPSAAGTGCSWAATTGPSPRPGRRSVRTSTPGGTTAGCGTPQPTGGPPASGCSARSSAWSAPRWRWRARGSPPGRGRSRWSGPRSAERSRAPVRPPRSAAGSCGC